jgi:hypothetical protein
MVVPSGRLEVENVALLAVPTKPAPRTDFVVQAAVAQE